MCRRARHSDEKEEKGATSPDFSEAFINIVRIAGRRERDVVESEQNTKLSGVNCGRERTFIPKFKCQVNGYVLFYVRERKRRECRSFAHRAPRVYIYKCADNPPRASAFFSSLE